MKTTLTIPEANCLARGRARVTASPVDRRPWQVEGDGWVEAHEPMTRGGWLAFLAEKAVGSRATPERRRPETYEADINGRKVRVTIPEGIDEQDLFDALKDNLSPEAIAAVVAYLQPAHTNNDAVNRQLRWFADQLTKLVGGHEQQGRLAEEVGL